MCLKIRCNETKRNFFGPKQGLTSTYSLWLRQQEVCLVADQLSAVLTSTNHWGFVTRSLGIRYTRTWFCAEKQERACLFAPRHRLPCIHHPVADNLDSLACDYYPTNELDKLARTLASDDEVVCTDTRCDFPAGSPLSGLVNKIFWCDRSPVPLTVTYQRIFRSTNSTPKHTQKRLPAAAQLAVLQWYRYLKTTPLENRHLRRPILEFSGPSVANPTLNLRV